MYTTKDNQMSKELIPFSYQGMSVRVIKDEKGEPWFLAKDVRDVLDIRQVTYAVSRLDFDEKSTVDRTHLGLNPGVSMWVVNEPGLYKLVLRSDKPEAKLFQRWVTHEVLPSIRKHGGGRS